MNAKTLKNLLEMGEEKVLLVDVRETDEASDEPYFEVLPENYLLIPLAVLSVLPREELTSKIMSAITRLHWEEKAVRIVTLCRSGRRSEMACQYFSQLGFSAESLDGGYGAWMEEG